MRISNWASVHPFFEDGAVLGRSVANAGFLKALLSADPYERYLFFLPDEKSRQSQEGILAQRFPALARRGAFRCGLVHDLPEAMSRGEVHVMHLSDCLDDFMPVMRARNRFSSLLFPVTGPTHSLSYARFAPIFLGHLWPGVTSRDAVIATSRAGADAVQAMYAALRQGYALDASAFPQPGIETVPLGVDPADFPKPDRDAALRATWRKKLRLGERDCAILCFARLSHASKMDLVPLVRAVRAAARGEGLPPLVLLLAGWSEPGDSFVDELASLAAKAGVTVKIRRSPGDAERKGLYAAADIFASPSDNVQETFGLTLAEAGVSGLPVVASSYDGYRDTVADGESGILVPTLGPSDTAGTDALAGIWYDNQYHLRLAQQTVVDSEQLGAALTRLAASPDLRRSMGQKGRQRVLERFTWEVVVRRHLALWEDLAARPLHREAYPSAHPLQPSFAKVFAAHPDQSLNQARKAGMRAVWTTAGEAVYRGLEFPIYYAGIESEVRPEVLKAILFRARKSITLAELAPAERGEEAALPVLWALKHGYLRLLAGDHDADGGSIQSEG